MEMELRAGRVEEDEHGDSDLVLSRCHVKSIFLCQKDHAVTKCADLLGPPIISCLSSDFNLQIRARP